MIKRIIIPVFLFLMVSMPQGVMSQGRFTERDSRLLDECRTLFSQADYSAAGASLDKWEQTAPDGTPVRTEEIEFMRVVIDA